MAYLNIAAVCPCTEAEGPGRRFAIWCQGCLRRCPGCCNPHMQPLERRSIVAVEELVKLIQKHQTNNNVEGVSFIGGEPILQAEGFAALAKNCQLLGLSVLLFTGYRWEELSAMANDHIKTLLDHTDILVDGEFVESLYDLERNWVGSSNQRVLFLSDRYKAGIEYEHRTHNTEIRVSTDKITINGWPIEIAY